jgi:5-methyltetrahydrofolate--homocysteine methyltransferase
MKASYLQLIKDRHPMIFDGAFGTQVQKANPSVKDFQGHDGCNEILNFSRPDIVEGIHSEYLLAGANIIETNTFGANRAKLGEYNLQNRVYELNKTAAQIARKAIDNFQSGDKPLFVCGTMGPTGYLLSSKDQTLSKATFDEVAEIFSEQANGLLDGGADILLLETQQDLLEVRAALYGIRRLLRERDINVPLQVQVTLDSTGHMLLGSTVEAFLGAVVSLNIDVIGFNCGTGPDEIAQFIQELLSLSPIPVSLLPNAGMPHNVNGQAVYNVTPEAFAAKLTPFVTEKGLSVSGGCCGTTPEHIRALANSLKGKSVSERIVPEACFCSTALYGKDLNKVARPVIIGERLNTQGSKKTKELVLSRNYDELFEIAVEQQKCGATLLDLCVATNETDDETGAMIRLVTYFRDRLETPLCIDSTEPSVMAAVLRVNPGSMMLNSINLEHNGEKAEKVLELARDFGCPVVALTIDDKGMAKTIEDKLNLASKLKDLACGKYGLPEHFLYIDPLVFTLATGESQSADAAANSIKAIRLIKEQLQGVKTVMGVSNVSFGLQPKARRVLNNIMLHHAVQAGLDAAIFNPLHIDNIESYDISIRDAAEDLLFNRKPGALEKFISLFEAASTGKSVDKSSEIREHLPLEKQLYSAITNRDRRGLKALDELLKIKGAHLILNEILLPAMAEVGEKMSSGELILPFVLQSAEVMQEAIKALEPHLKKGEQISKGKIVLATVYGDVHDIGKNLVGSILSNQGYDVIDLGKQVPVEKIIETVRAEGPDAVGLSALLVTTSKQMALCVKEFENSGISIPVLIGGAAVNREFAARISMLDNGKRYEGGIHYAKDAFEASKILDNISNGIRLSGNDSVPSKSNEKVMNCSGDVSMPSYGPHIEPPFWGTGDILKWPNDAILRSVDKERLFKAQWGGGKLGNEVYLDAKEKEFFPAFERLTKEILDLELIDARGLYGFFPVFTYENKLIVLDPNDFSTELASFDFPRATRHHCRSIADYFNPEGDLIAIQVVTIGKLLGNRCREFFQKEDKYSMGYMLNGLGNYIVESLADRVTSEIQRGIGLNTGKRYSFGYPGLPPIEEQKKIFEIMSIEERLGIELTSGFQMVPEHSTLGIYVYHPEAEYFV